MKKLENEEDVLRLLALQNPNSSRVLKRQSGWGKLTKRINRIVKRLKLALKLQMWKRKRARLNA